MSRITLWCSTVALLLTAVAVQAAVTDAPHNETHGMGCTSCHTYSLWWTYSPVQQRPDYASLADAVCLTCHGGAGTMGAPKALNHSSSVTGSTNHSPWGGGCIDCHNPHYQDQLNWATPGSNAYLVEGTISSAIYSSSAKETTITYAVSKGNTNWPAVGTAATDLDWSNKSRENNGRGLILLQDTSNQFATFSIVSATPSQVVVLGELAIANGNTFGLIFGDLIRDTIKVGTGSKSVKFFDPNGGYVAAGSDTTGICQVCHEHTSRYKDDGVLPSGNDTHAARSDKDCVTCHLHELGFRQNFDEGMAHDHTMTAVPACVTCHATATTAPYAASGQTHSRLGCMTCHNSNGYLIGSAAGKGAGSTCQTCHNVDAKTLHHATAKATSGNCGLCHVTVNTEWAASGHGDLAGDAWIHYDWDGKDVTPPATNRAACQRCHTATGAMNYMTQGAAYLPANNDFSHLGVGQNEVLACRGCHTPLTEAVPNFPTGVLFPSGTSVTMGDASNVCISCHLGRESTVSVNAKALSATTANFVNVHYMAAGAALFGTETKGGYEWADRTYRGKNGFAAHPANLRTCIDCHMKQGTKDHEMSADAAVCISCHGGTSFETLGGSPSDNHEDLTALAATLYTTITNRALVLDPARAIVFDLHTNPYWFKDVNANGVKDATETVGYAFNDRDLLGAAYNYQLVAREPGGFVHNGTYLKQLLYDSIVKLLGTPDAGILVSGRTTMDSDMATKTAQWATSGHGDPAGDAWIHYDWDGNDVTPPATNRQSCQRCHTATGSINFMNDMTGYNAANNLFTLGVGENEILSCNGCHTNVATGALPNLSAGVKHPSTVSSVVVNLGTANNVCLTCHFGRKVTQDVNNYTVYSSLQNPHHAVAGGVFMGTVTKVGYEYAGKTYRGKNTFSYHAPEMQTCVGCHLRGAAKDHSFVPEVADCTGCHGGTSFATLGGTPGQNKAHIDALAATLLSELNTYALSISKPGITYNGAGGFTRNDTGASYNVADVKMFRAIYNFMTLYNEPYAYIHNGTYMKQLLTDSIMDLNPNASLLGDAVMAESCNVCHADRSVEAVAAHDVSAFLATYTVSGITPTFVDHDVNPGTADRFAVTFTVMDGTTPVTNLLAKAGWVRANLSKLVPVTDGSPSTWANYIGTTTTTGRPSTVSSVISGATNLVHAGNGVYTMTFNGASGQDVKNHPLAGKYAWNGTATHRVAIQISGDNSVSGPPAIPATFWLKSTNAWLDFVPNGGAVTASRDITTTASCNSCHVKINIHSGGRYAPEFCVTCHTDDRGNGRTESTNVDALGNFVIVPPATTTATYKVDGFAQGDFPVMIHKIHMGNKLTRQGYDYAGVLFNHIGYPQEQANCRKCHSGSGANASTDGDNWKNVPSRKACGACHDNMIFVPGGLQGSWGWNHNEVMDNITDSDCAGCHSAAEIEDLHTTVNHTVNNPAVPINAANFTYDIKEVTTVDNVDGTTSPRVTFRILKDGAPVTNFVSGTNPLSGFSGAPSFLVSYAAAQDGITAPADFNNLGKSAAQPATASINTLALNTLTPDVDGYYTATLAATTAKYPAGATMRTVALQGYFTQVTPALARHAISVVKTVTGDAVRRQIVDSAKCAGCHEVFEGHGGNRNIDATSTGTLVCVLCHNPNLSSSGRGADLSQSPTNAATIATIAALGSDPLTYPEESQNFKDLIHGIHASVLRDGTAAEKVEFVRDRGTSGVFYYDFSHVTFPSDVKNCTICHKPGTFGTSSIPGNALNSTDVTTDGSNATTAAVKAARLTVPNATDQATRPLAAACTSCHALIGGQNGHGPAVRGSGGVVAPVDPHGAGFSVAASCQTCHTGSSDVVVDTHGNNCSLCHTGKPSRDNEKNVATIANGTAAAGNWTTVNCATCHGLNHGATHAMSASAVCAGCHASKAANIATGHLNCATCHLSSRAEVVAALTAGLPLTCETCHPNNHGTVPPDHHITDAAVGTLCANCHADKVANAATTHATCLTCHASTRSEVMLAIAAKAPTTCDVCHVTNIQTLHHSSSKAKANDCVSCHAGTMAPDHSDKVVIAADCSGCHVTESSAPAGTSSGISVSSTDGLVHTDCISCHTFETTTLSGILRPATEVNGFGVTAISAGTCTHCHTTAKQVIHHGNINAAQGSCEYCHDDPRLDEIRSAFEGPAGYDGVPPTQLACVECHVMPKAVATLGDKDNTRTNGWANNTMTVTAFNKGSNSKKTGGDWSTPYAKTIVHTIPNTVGQINNWGICIGCHDGTHPGAAQVQPQHALPTSINNDTDFCGTAQDMDKGRYLPGRGTFNDISNMNYFAEYFRIIVTHPSINSTPRTRGGGYLSAVECAHRGPVGVYGTNNPGVINLRGNGRTYLDTVVDSGAATSTNAGMMTIPNPWTGVEHNNSSIYADNTKVLNGAAASAGLFIDQLPVFPAKTPNAEVGKSAAVLSVNVPKGSTVKATQAYAVTYTLATPYPNARVALYYDTDNVVGGGVAVTGACATAVKGTNATCSWDTTGMTEGSYYLYGVVTDGVNVPVTSSYFGPLTIAAAPVTDTTAPTIGTSMIQVYPFAYGSPTTVAIVPATFDVVANIDEPELTLTGCEYTLDSTATPIVWSTGTLSSTKSRKNTCTTRLSNQTNNTSFNIQMRATNSAGLSGTSATLVVRVDAVAPTSGTLSIGTPSDQRTINWTASVEANPAAGTSNSGLRTDPFRYDLRRGIAAGDGAPTCSTGISVFKTTSLLTYTDYSVTNNGQYAYTLCSYDKIGNISASQALVTNPTLPGAAQSVGLITPTLMSGTDPVYVGKTFTVTAPITVADPGVSAVGACSMTLDNINYTFAGTVSGSASPYTCTATVPAWAAQVDGAQLTVNIRLISASGTVTGTPLSLTVRAALPVDGVLTVTPGSLKNTLAWTPATDAVVGLKTTSTYVVRALAGAVAPTCSSGAAVATTPTTALTVVHSPLVSGAQWSYRVCATNAVGTLSTGATGTGTALP